MSILIKTIEGRKKRMNCYVTPSTVLPAITHVAVGDGGQDSMGNLKVPTGNETQLYNEVYRTNVTTERVDDVTYKFSFVLNTIEEPSLAGKKINEMALIDDEGTMITIETVELFGSSGVPENFRGTLTTQLVVE